MVLWIFLFPEDSCLKTNNVAYSYSFFHNFEPAVAYLGHSNEKTTNLYEHEQRRIFIFLIWMTPEEYEKFKQSLK